MPYFGVKINISPVLLSGKHGILQVALFCRPHFTVLSLLYDSSLKRKKMLRCCIICSAKLYFATCFTVGTPHTFEKLSGVSSTFTESVTHGSETGSLAQVVSSNLGRRQLLLFGIRLCFMNRSCETFEGTNAVSKTY